MEGLQFGFLSKSRGSYVPGCYSMRDATPVHTLTLVAASTCLLLVTWCIIRGLKWDTGEAKGTFATPPTQSLGGGSVCRAPQLRWWPEVADATILPGHTAPEAAISQGLGSTRLWTL